jgi:ABC-type transport system, involved in lipoprotein release, permease component
MKLLELIRLAYRDISQRRLRTSLTMLSVAIGVASIIALVSQTAGIQQSVIDTLYKLGPSTMILMPRGYQLTQADVARISELQGVTKVIPVVQMPASIYRSGQQIQVTLLGIRSTDLESLLGDIKILEGSIYPDAPVPVAIVGYTIAFPPEQGGSQSIYVGQPLLVEIGFGAFRQRIQLQIVGILAQYGSTPFVSPDSSIVIPLDELMKILNRRSYGMLIVKASNVATINDLSNTLNTIYGNNVQILTVQQLGETVSTIIGQFGILLASIAGISLSVAGLGTMNIMMITVLERTREIGVMKAIGFKNRDILLLYIVESSLIGIIGGLIGIALGIGGSQVLPHFLNYTFLRTPQQRGPGPQMQGQQQIGLSYTPIIPLDITLIAYLIAVLVSIAAGLYPAWRASKMEPVRALRYE